MGGNDGKGICTTHPRSFFSSGFDFAFFFLVFFEAPPVETFLRFHPVLSLKGRSLSLLPSFLSFLISILCIFSNSWDLVSHLSILSFRHAFQARSRSPDRTRPPLPHTQHFWTTIPGCSTTVCYCKARTRRPTLGSHSVLPDPKPRWWSSVLYRYPGTMLHHCS